MIRSLIALSLLTAASLAFADPVTPVADRRQERQDERIEQGVASGELTAAEQQRLENQQARNDRREARFKSDGRVTAGERVRLQRAENRSSRAIRRQKHDAQDRD